MTTILAFGGGVDSTALLAAHLDPAKAAWATGTDIDDIEDALADITQVVFADPGAEFGRTYRNVETAQALCAEAGLDFEIVRKRDRHGNVLTIQDWLLNNGTVPVMPGGPHVCSLKFKGEVMQRFANEAFAGQDIEWLVGIESTETKRVQRFQGGKGSDHSFRWPLVDLGWDRDDCLAVIAACWPHEVAKSSCVFCPFMSAEEITDTAQNEPQAWALAKIIEAEFEKTSAIKHNRWLDAGQPLNRGGRAPRGMWRRDSWSEGQRLFVKTIGGSRLSTAEWATQ